MWKTKKLLMFEKKFLNKIFSPKNEIVIEQFRIPTEEFRGVYRSAILNYKND